MGADDKPENLSPAQQEQYWLYINKKLHKGEIPRTPERWADSSAFWRTQTLRGQAFERGLDIVFGLPEAGWGANQRHDTADGKYIKADRYLSPELSPDGVGRNIEAKAGSVEKQRGLSQLDGYIARLQAGERVDYYIRASKESRMPPDVRARVAALEREYPDQFTVKRLNEKVFQRIQEAGARAIKKDEREALNRNLAKLPAHELAREVNALTTESIGRDYAREIEQAKERGIPIGMDQLRFMNDALRDMAAADLKADRQKAIESRRALGLKHHENRGVELFLEQKALDKNDVRMGPIDAVTHELIAREREEIAREVERVQAQIKAEREKGREVDARQLEQQHLALGNALGQVQKTEREIFNEVARGVPKERGDEFLLAMDIIAREKDEKTTAGLAQLSAAAKEAADKERARMREQQLKEQRERAARGGIPERDIRAIQAAWPQPGEVRRPEAAAVADGERSRQASEDRARAAERERLKPRGREPS
jgi:hypothetical protein